MVRYQRDILVLHELKRAGAGVPEQDRELSHDDINLLSAKDALSISVAVRKACGAAGLKQLFKEQLAASEQRWRDMNAGKSALPLKPCVAEITITGISFEEFSENMKTQEPFLQNCPAVHPDHFYIAKDGETIKGAEIFGMYGGPSECGFPPDPNLSVPIPRDET